MQISKCTFAGAKKHLKKESRKPPAYVADTLGPALFSTPDIIRRVGTSEGKMPDSAVTPTTPPAISTSGSSAVPTSPTTSLNISTPLGSAVAQNAGFSNKKTASSTLEPSVQPESRLSLDGSNVTSGNGSESKSAIKAPLAEELQPASLDSGMIRLR